MVKVRLLAPTNDNEGKPHAMDEVVDVDEELANEWRRTGKASLIEDEERSAAAAAQGNYGEVTGREEVGPLGGGGNPPGPQQDQPEEEEDQPPKKGKK